ncbi:alpha/beta fold hydrolase [Streptomyces sp. 1331.2]|uniref:alpha/beta fold hydrolase n=1 Tax=Streptomyces sp. 1331.2 TaxID=1938835 RepID=UPI000BD2680D|nr:alpha/beta hydrolase [Streptomyces sp. 1331.2]SOB88445.1 Pimeloyl-ACP methyl ester carboxylesterase [Streptomyces sp. 1331.2]
MNALNRGELVVPGATLYFEVRGSGEPLLLIPGSASDAVVFEPLAEVLAADHRVICYDPRGISRSPLDGPPVDQRVEVHTEDARRLLDRLTEPDEPVRVFGSCGGGLVAMELAVRHPELIRTAVAHEPPATGLLPEAEQYRAFFDRVHEVFRRDGVASALRALQPLFGGRPAPPLPEFRDNFPYFLAHLMLPFTRFLPDLDALATVADRIVVAGGRDSRGYPVHRPAVVLAAWLGRRPVEFPGGHVGYAKDPDAFAARLVEVFAAAPEPRALPNRGCCSRADGARAEGAPEPTELRS